MMQTDTLVLHEEAVESHFDKINPLYPIQSLSDAITFLAPERGPLKNHYPLGQFPSRVEVQLSGGLAEPTCVIFRCTLYEILALFFGEMSSGIRPPRVREWAARQPSGAGARNVSRWTPHSAPPSRSWCSSWRSSAVPP
jgi:hypothetical protein